MAYNLEKNAKVYDTETQFSKIFIEKIFEEYKVYFTGDRCLELGAGNGYMTKKLVEEFKNVTVVDGSETLLKKMDDQNNLKKVYSMFEDYKTNEKYDTILMNHILEHLENPVTILKRSLDWITGDGHILIGVPNAKSFHRLAGVKMGLLETEYDLNERDYALGHKRVYDFNMLLKHVDEAGLKVKKEGGVFLKFLSNKQIDDYLSPDAIDAYFNIAPQFYQSAALIYVIVCKK